MPNPFNKRYTIRKINEESRLVTAIASIVTKADGTQIVDHDDHLIEIAELEKAFIKAFAHGGHDKGGEMHVVDGGVDVVQHFTLSKSERLALGFGAGPEIGIVKLHVRDDALWEKVKKGDYPELSIEGDAIPVKIEEAA